jgi:hypothetical protein
MGKLPCSVEDARLEIEAILDSGVFARSSRQGKLLEYLFQKMLSGEAADLKEYRIAVEVLDKPEEFDPHTDATVRVEAHRLRKKLEKFYETSGRDHAIHVTLPAGHYSLSFQRNEGAGSLRGSLPGARRAAYWAAAAAGLLLFAVVYFPRPGEEALLATEAMAPPAALETHVPATDDPEPEATRILVGHSGEYVDPAGRRWSGDSFFDGGRIRAVAADRILRTGRPELFRRVREGDFIYRVPLAPGEYEMRLYFVDPDGPEGPTLERGRIFEVLANGNRVLPGYDIAAGAGYNADVRAFAGLQPDEKGILELRFTSIKGRAVVSAIEILPMQGGVPRPVRIIAQSRPYRDMQGLFWAPDDYYSGGRADGYPAIIQGSPDPGVLSGERYGNFEYFIPVPEGEYQLTLHFGEAWFGPRQHGGGSVGSRVFDVLLDHEVVLDKFDLLREAPPRTLISKTFRKVKPARCGKIKLAFISHENWAEIRAIEVVPEPARLAAGR